MPVALFTDHNVRVAVPAGLRDRGVDVLTAFEDRSHRADDSTLLDRATSLGRVLFTHDDDLLAEAARRSRAGKPFSGVIYVHQEALDVGTTIAELELIAKVVDPHELAGIVVYLPVR